MHRTSKTQHNSHTRVDVPQGTVAQTSAMRGFDAAVSISESAVNDCRNRQGSDLGESAARLGCVVFAPSAPGAEGEEKKKTRQ
eukprot:2271903-Rhodomonas_salina.1